ncbi:hypothetical protein EAX61_11025 [Dokdonia sinensis]|uniref:Uncharacterized protein n=1 Tax=Dokdonia sinensis TaxID=2479847 RepID=A0A3M0G0D1_9FLAO|nr:hypothetical protein [Dokdonia sinensis]RMB57637.1 hypothetical protein EAX61_11025 [Dokdonia sinensis]
MKTLKNILKVAILAGVTTAIAQTKPPKPPAPPSNTTSSSTSSNTSVITQSGNYGKGGNTSFSVSNSNNEYRVKSRYPDNRYPAVKDFLMAEMGTKHMQANGKSIAWSLEGDDDTVYEIELSESKLNIELDKTIASPDMIAKFEDMGNILRTLISGGNERQEIQRLERDADRARRDAERMQREAERLRAMSVRDAERLSREASLLEREAEKLSRVSKRSGGIDGYVRDVLREPSTKYDMNTSSNNGWKWPAMQNALITELVKNGLVSEGEDIVFVKEDNGIYVNGEKMGPAMWSKYNNLFRKYDFGRIGDISFYKQGNHIVVLDGPDDLEDLLEELEDEGLIEITKSKFVIQINGTSVVENGKKLSEAETKRWNTVLHKEGVIPAPGKTIVMDKNSFSLGYSFDKSTLGIWMSRD